MLWNNNFSGSRDDWCTDAVETNDKGFILTGFAESIDYDVTNRHDNLAADGWVVKIDSMGNLIWQHAMGGTDGDEFYSILQAEDSSFVTVGFTMSNDDDVSGNHSSAQDNWLVQFSELEWFNHKNVSKPIRWWVQKSYSNDWSWFSIVFQYLWSQDLTFQIFMAGTQIFGLQNSVQS